MKQSRLRLLLENFFVFGLGSVISKIVPLVMLPIITRMLPNSTYFGVNDLSNTIISFASAIAMFGMYDAMFRYYFEKDSIDYKVTVCSTALGFTLISSLIMFAILVAFRDLFAWWVFNDDYLGFLVVICAFSAAIGTLNTILSAPTRMQNKRRVFLITNTISPILAYGIAVVLLLKGYYITALPIGGVCSVSAMGCIFFVLNRKWFNLKQFSIDHLKKLLVIAIPIVPSFLLYWIFHSCDRLMISEFLGVREVGIYAIGSKLGQASQLIYAAFTGGWQYYYFATMKEKDQVENITKIFETLAVISFVSTAFVSAFSYSIYTLFFEGDYIEGFIIAPYLFLAPLVLMLYQTIAGKFIANLKTWPIVVILSIGAIVNVVLNLILIPRIGIEGAAIATLVGYIVAFGVCYVVMLKCKYVVSGTRFLLVSGLMLLYFFIWRLFFSKNIIIGLGAAIIYATICAIFYKSEIVEIFGRLHPNNNQ